MDYENTCEVHSSKRKKRSRCNFSWSQWKIDDFFEKNIRRYCENWELLGYKKAIALWFSEWYYAILSKKHWYANLKEFAVQNGLKYNDWIYNSKQKIDDFFEKNIKSHCENGRLLGWRELMDKWFKTWYVAIISKKNWYKDLKDFAEKNGLEYGVWKYNSKEKLDAYFRDNIQQYCKNGKILGCSELKKMWFTRWYEAVYSGKNWYANLKEFAEMNGYTHGDWKYDSKQKIDDFFEKNIKSLCKWGVVPRYAKLKELWFKWWYSAVFSEKNWYGSYKNFLIQKGLIHDVNWKYNSKEKIDDFFEKNIKPHCKNGVMLSYGDLKRLGFNWWYYAVVDERNWYGSMKSFTKQQGFSHNHKWKYNSKERIDDFFEKNIKPHCKNGVMCERKDLVALWFVSWVSAVNSGKYGYEWLADFRIKHNFS